ncbi:MAG TPA: flagellar export chaperone FliS [Bryobacteraceae bacterium]|jgi:flagellar protein FliS
MEANFLNGGNPYHAYAEGAVGGTSPLRLVIALYEGAQDATRRATGCLAAGDIWGRSKAINKTVAILSELLASLDLERGGEIAQNLRRLYSYMQTRLLEAHARATAAPLTEVDRLLGNLLEGWHRAEARQAGETAAQAGPGCQALATMAGRGDEPFEERPYAAYFSEAPEAWSGTALSC